jgi:WD40 repeat protein
VWDAETKDTLSIIQGFHGVGVCAVDFSCNGKLLLTVGLEDSHGVAVWKWTDGKCVF